MKKLLLIGLILVICVLAFPQGVLADESTATVNANIDQTLSFLATGPEAPYWALKAVETTTTTTNAEAIKLDVTSNALWSVNIKSTTPADGKMVPKYTESGAQALSNKLKIAALTSGFQDVDSTVEILSGGRTDEDGETHYKALQQQTVIGDSRLIVTDNVYTINLEFQCIQSA